MELTKNLNENIAAYEQQTGKTVSAELRKLIEEMATAGDRFEALGESDAAQGRAPKTEAAFIKWGERELSDSQDKDRPIVDLMYKCYLDGYQKGRAVLHESENIVSAK